MCAAAILATATQQPSIIALDRLALLWHFTPVFRPCWICVALEFY